MRPHLRPAMSNQRATSEQHQALTMPPHAPTLHTDCNTQTNMADIQMHIDAINNAVLTLPNLEMERTSTRPLYIFG